MPEDAFRAFTELDGTCFQGRMLHLLPGKAKNEDSDITQGNNFVKLTYFKTI